MTMTVARSGLTCPPLWSETPCELWTGCLDDKGYGRQNRKGQSRRVHRARFEARFGPIPAGMEPDHLCRNRACMNTAHLELVSHRVNVLRGEAPSSHAARRTECDRGHSFDEGTTHERADHWGRRCRRCDRERKRAERAQHRATLPPTVGDAPVS